MGLVNSYLASTSTCRGWIREFLKGTKRTCSIGDINTGLVSGTLTLNDPSSDVKVTAVLVAGMLGFNLHEASVQPFQGWALLLPEDSTGVIHTRGKTNFSFYRELDVIMPRTCRLE